ncbi:hypothetical protein DL769_006106 [Monosporascus sp. CRB-8-3]|nr:hypothetical protein DL769_006106 [Monosporascus sp. CRB-8-3]
MYKFPFVALQQWAPFKIDALGLVTILGASQADMVLGQLTRNYLTEWLPLLGAYVIADNSITNPLPGFSLYNITDGILATDLAGWFARWLLCQDLSFCSSTIYISPIVASTSRRQRLRRDICSHSLGVLTLIPMVLSILIGDWWGLANSISMLASVVVRRIILEQNRRAIDLAVDESEKTSCEEVKVFVTLPNGKAVAIRTTRGIVIDCLLTTPRPPNLKRYTASRAVGWFAFGCHIISLGMSSLVCQLVAVILLICPTVLVAWQIGMDRSQVGRKLAFSRDDAQVPFRAAAYARLDLTPEQEESLVKWNLAPHRSNKLWWDKYRNVKALRNFESWDTILGKSR